MMSSEVDVPDVPKNWGVATSSTSAASPEHARALRRVNFISRTWSETHNELDLVLDVVKKCTSKPKITFDLCNRVKMFTPLGPADSIIESYGQKLFEIRDKLPVTGVHLHGLWSPWRLQRLSLFHQLEELSLFEGPRYHFEEAVDFDTIFKDSPNLTKFTGSSVTMITSFPRNLRELRNVRGYHKVAYLDLVTWKAICDLQNLRSLDLHCNDIDNFAGQPIQFKSIKLRNLRTIFEVNADVPIMPNRILTPIYIACPTLTSVSIELVSVPFSLDLLRGLSEDNSAFIPIGSQLRYRGTLHLPSTRRPCEKPHKPRASNPAMACHERFVGGWRG